MNADWQLFSSTQVADDALVSDPAFSPAEYHNISIPSTVMSGLIQNGHYPDLYLEAKLDTVDREPFQVPWWYRKSFKAVNTAANANYTLCLEGINYKADIWLNGQKVADSDTIEGPFGIWYLDVTPHIAPGENLLAIKVIPPVPGDLTIGFVDWSPEAPDRNMGLWRGVKLLETGPVSVRHPFVATQVNTETLTEASLTVSALVINHAAEPQKARVTVSFDDVSIHQDVDLAPHQEKEVVFSPHEYRDLVLINPRLWWPVNLGEQNLVHMDISVAVGHAVSDHSEFRFGIRQIDSYRTADDHLGFKVNGKPILIRGGGWVDDMLLADPDEKVRAQVDYAKHMNLNTIRLEGFWGRNKTLYDRCDEQGIMLMIGWSCQWEWEYYSGRPQDEYIAISDEAEQQLHARAYTDQVRWLRNHPSVFLWNFGSDKLPRPELESLLHTCMAAADTTRPLLSHCGSSVSEISGSSGVKMHGPYDWVSPNYWYLDKRFGGAYGFNTETGPGPQMPTLETIRRIIPEAQQWPRGPIWDYHSGRFEFNTLDRFLLAFNARYGEAHDLEEFVFKNQISNYEAIRPMFEAFAVNKYNSTGVIQWMLNSAWPKIIWQLYDYYLIPNAAFYGTRKAASPLLPVYHYGDHHVYVNNDYLHSFNNLTLQVSMYNAGSELVFEANKSFSIAENTAIRVLELPQPENLSNTYFLDLRLTNEEGTELQQNFYWLSTREDTHDWDATTWIYTPGREFADLTGIHALPEAHVSLSNEIIPDENAWLAKVSLHNESDVIAFFNELRLVDSHSGKTMVPVFWDDNYISLLPGEKRILTARIPHGHEGEHQPLLVASGWNAVYSQ